MYIFCVAPYIPDTQPDTKINIILPARHIFLRFSVFFYVFTNLVRYILDNNYVMRNSKNTYNKTNTIILQLITITIQLTILFTI